MKPRRTSILTAALPAALALLLAACGSLQNAQKVPEPPARKELAAGLALYNAGDYPGAIKLLSGSQEISKADKATQLEAIKYTAFSYCLTGKPVPCRQQFQKALKLDPSFDLAPGEQGHPMWAPVWEKAKKPGR